MLRDSGRLTRRRAIARAKVDKSQLKRIAFCSPRAFQMALNGEMTAEQLAFFVALPDEIYPSGFMDGEYPQAHFMGRKERIELARKLLEGYCRERAANLPEGA